VQEIETVSPSGTAGKAQQDIEEPGEGNRYFGRFDALQADLSRPVQPIFAWTRLDQLGRRNGEFRSLGVNELRSSENDRSEENVRFCHVELKNIA